MHAVRHPASMGKVLSEISRAGKIHRQITLKAKGMGHETVRQIRLTPQDTVLAAEFYSNIVREYKWSGEVLREFALSAADGVFG